MRERDVKFSVFLPVLRDDLPEDKSSNESVSYTHLESNEKLNAICICSDPTASKKSSKNETDDNLTSVTDLALPASTNVQNIVKQFKWIQATKKEGMTVVFSTYQSIDVIAKAQGIDVYKRQIQYRQHQDFR